MTSPVWPASQEPQPALVDLIDMDQSYAGERQQEMSAIEGKYGIITAEKKQFHPGEPVFLLRATDRNAPIAIIDYAERCLADGCSHEHYLECYACHDRMATWQEMNPQLVKKPD